MLVTDREPSPMFPKGSTGMLAVADKPYRAGLTPEVFQRKLKMFEPPTELEAVWLPREKPVVLVAVMLTDTVSTKSPRFRTVTESMTTELWTIPAKGL